VAADPAKIMRNKATLALLLLASLTLCGQAAKESRVLVPSVEERIGKLEVLVPELQAKIQEQTVEFKSMRDQLTVISTKLDFLRWIGSAVGLLLIVRSTTQSPNGSNWSA
jgi:hypothetical protein